MIPDLATTPEAEGQSKSGLKYHIHGTVQPTVVIDLQPHQTIFSDAGGMSWMTGTVDMDTNTGGGLGGMMKRAFSGATLFVIDFSVKTAPGQVAFAADFPGKIIPIELNAGESLIMHKHAFVCAEKSVTLDISFTKKLGAGLLGGEGFVLQKVTGPGMAFAELDGDPVEYRLQANEIMKVEPGHIAMFEPTVTFDITRIKGIKNMLFGGEGIFLGELKGPGRIWLHSMAVSHLAHRIGEFLPGPQEASSAAGGAAGLVGGLIGSALGGGKKS
jgi:uncharacterized protein (TIGR00266 family)